MDDHLARDAALGDAVPSVRSATRTAASVPDGGLGSSAVIGAVALSVLLLGGVIGSIARRRSS